MNLKESKTLQSGDDRTLQTSSYKVTKYGHIRYNLMTIVNTVVLYMYICKSG